MFEGLFFYILAAMTFGAAVCVVTARHPVYAVLWLVLAFLNAAGLMVLLAGEFLGMVLAVVYVGTVAILFLFVIMMLDIQKHFQELHGRSLWVPLLLGVVLLSEILLALYATLYHQEAFQFSDPLPVGEENAKMIGHVLYTDYFPVFQGVGLILLVAMVGAILLTHRERRGIRTQSPFKQSQTVAQDVVELLDLPSGHGIPRSKGEV